MCYGWLFLKCEVVEKKNFRNLDCFSRVEKWLLNWMCSQCPNWIYCRIMCAMKPGPYSPFFINSWQPSPILRTSSCYTETANISLFSFPQVAADDLDQGQNGQVTYSIRSSSMSGLFKIDPLTGSITTAAIMDREIWTQTKWVFFLCLLSHPDMWFPSARLSLWHVNV